MAASEAAVEPGCRAVGVRTDEDAAELETIDRPAPTIRGHQIRDESQGSLAVARTPRRRRKSASSHTDAMRCAGRGRGERIARQTLDNHASAGAGGGSLPVGAYGRAEGAVDKAMTCAHILLSRRDGRHFVF